MDDRRRPKIIIIVAFMVFAIIPLLVGIIVVIAQMNSAISVEDALRTDISGKMAEVIAEQGELDLNKVVMHGIASSGDWGVVGVFPKNAEMFGDAFFVIIHKEDSDYKVIDVGNEFDSSYFAEIGAPDDLARKMQDNDTAAKYAEALFNSKYNSRNKYPLIQKLPYKSDDLRISYYFRDDLVDEDGVSIPIITIRGVDAVERKRALDIIEEYGYDLGSYRIEFINFNNRFIETEEVDLESSDEDGGEGL